jgi:hypothetical protein
MVPPAKSFEFDGMLWTTDHDMPLNHKPTVDNIATAKTPTKKLVLSALTNQKSIPQWQSKSPASGQPSALMVIKSTAVWQTKFPASGQPSALMEQKSTPQWQSKSPALGKPSAQMVNKSTASWQTKSQPWGIHQP